MPKKAQASKEKDRKKGLPRHCQEKHCIWKNKKTSDRFFKRTECHQHKHSYVECSNTKDCKYCKAWENRPRYCFFKGCKKAYSTRRSLLVHCKNEHGEEPDFDEQVKKHSQMPVRVLVKASDSDSDQLNG